MVSANRNIGLTWVFKNGSELDIVGIGDSSRGGRRNGVLLEEVNFCLNISFPHDHEGYAIAC